MKKLLPVFTFMSLLLIGHVTFSRASGHEGVTPSAGKNANGGANGSSLDFDGTNDAVKISNSSLFNFTTQYTFEAMIYVKGYKYGTIVSKFDDDGNNRSWMINMGEGGDVTKIYVVHTSAGTWTNPIQWNTGFTPSLNTWYHIAVTFDGSLASNNIKLYVNGTLQSQANWKYSLVPQATNMYFGGYDPNGNGLNGGAADRFFNGKLDEIRIWNRALCEDQINFNRSCELTAPQNGLVALYHFNQGEDAADNSAVTSLADASGNGLDGILTNFTLNGAGSNWLDNPGVTTGLTCTTYTNNVQSSLTGSTNIVCYGASTGTATVSAWSGSTPYTYSWATSGKTTSDATGLSAGTHTCTVKDACGTVSTQTVTLTQPATAITFTQSPTICAGQSLVVGTHTYTSSGTYTDVLAAKNNCDSTVTTYLTISPAIASTQTLTVCAGQSVTVGTHTYTSTGTYTDVLAAKNNCDSTVTTYLTISPAIASTQTLTVCAGQSVVVGTHTYTSTGTYTDVFAAKNNCDSTVTTYLTVHAPVNVGVTVNNNVLTADANGAQYQWIDCNNGNAPINGETNKVYTAGAAGSYAVIVTEGNCKDTSACETIIITGITGINAPLLRAYPNPTSGHVMLELTSIELLTITNALGQVVYQQHVQVGKQEIDLTAQPNGIYIITVSDANQIQHLRLVKE